MLYHVSNHSGIKVLEPGVSSHGKAYVYAIDNVVTALLFGAKQDDFDFLIDEDENGKTVVYECYPNAFECVYKGKSCSIYEVDEKGFYAWCDFVGARAGMLNTFCGSNDTLRCAG